MVKWGVVLGSFLVCAACTHSPPPYSAQQWTVWVESSLTRIQPTDSPQTNTVAAIQAARNEAEAFQVIVRAPATQMLRNVDVATSDLVGPATISQSNITCYREQYVPVHVRSAHPHNRWYAPHPSGQWPDALIPSGVPGGIYSSFPFVVPASHNQPVWIEIYVPQGTPAGTYTGTITVTADHVAPVTIPLTLTVWDFTLPDRPALASAFGSYDYSFSIAHQYSAGSDQSALKANLYAALRAHRLGVGIADRTTATTNAMLQQRAIEVSSDDSDVTLAEIKTLFVDNGWNDGLVVFPVDEPSTDGQYRAINRLASRFQALGIPLLATIQNSTAWTAVNGSVDIWVPVFYECISNTAQIRAKLAQGNRVWSYAAGVQPNKAPTWLLDYDLIHYRIPAWLNYSHGQTGLLYWTTAYWEAGDPWTNAANVSPDTGNGEGVLFYPGDKVGAANAAIPSLRLKAIRDGVEDYDYLVLLAQLGDPAFAASLAQALAPTWDRWSHDPTALVAARAQAATRIIALGTGLPTYPNRTR
ncbi:hypothetical protein MELA_00864 [Candidatus Methylomirabilis lanthanidiphila]|uniref:Uncharacterized protein n=1 Tax=Candidatus Methylomirabilis lanthanidiphila TaxID=2211376 RepID=A0A564ZGL9_9BACT|nr:hypothetical protein MELA_00864 [Candidatus Methylomirabilis lanthanidiphila]